jgi:3-dehydroquinate synthase
MTDNNRSDAEPPATVEVALGPRSYSIHIGHRLLDQAGAILRPLLKRPRCVIVTDGHVAVLHLQSLEAVLVASGITTAAVVVPPGEASKSYEGLSSLCDQLLAAGVERSDLVIAFGGGVIGDLAGFASAVLRRGVGYVQVPTTLLAQVDSSVGGKTGINSALGKNLIGAFHQPQAVIADLALLRTLPDRELRAGYAEVVKYGLIGDSAFFTWLEAHGPDVLACKAEALKHAVATSCRAKAAIVAADETETGPRALLNLGHTFGHALEAATGYGDRLIHGEAVAIGMAMAFRLSERLGRCPPGTAARVTAHLGSLGLPTGVCAIRELLPDAAGLLAIMRHDKKARAGKLAFILVRGIGETYVETGIPEEAIIGFLADELAMR